MASISVVVPVYNVGKYVRKCINSILDQSFSDFELIIVDDGSTDDSYNICQECAQKDNRIRLIHKKNSGLVSSWKLGVKESNSELIAFIDSDDFVENDYLKDLYTCYKEYKVQMVIAPAKKYINEKQIDIKYKIKPGFYDYKNYKKNILPRILNDKGLFQSRVLLPSRWGKLISKELVLHNMKYVDNRSTYGEDLSLLIPIFLDIKSIYLVNDKKASYVYRIRKSSMIRGYDKNRWTSVKLVYSNLYKAYISKGKNPQILDQLSVDYLSSIIQCAKNEVKRKGNNFQEYECLMNEIRHSRLFQISINKGNNFSISNKIILKFIKKGNIVENCFFYWMLKLIFILGIK